jgi:hypothetical protein
MPRSPLDRLRAAALLGVLVAVPAAAQTSGDGFLLRSPVGAVAFRVGYDRPFASSDVFDQDVDQLTLSRGDFGALHLGTDLSIHVGRRLDIVLGSTYAGASEKSKFRHYLDNNDAPIEQTTMLRRLTLTGGLKAYLAPPGRSVGRFAWIPNKFAPYVGAGGGALWSRYQQEGDFIDFATDNLRVFNSEFRSDRWTPEAHALVGTDISLSPTFALTTEARYTWARAPLGQDFQGFDRIDLSGVSLTTGISVRF